MELAEDIVVTIQCITYNHKNYLRQALDSFLMQETTFKFEVIVHDDCSTDGTTDIVREYAEKYPDIIRPMYEEENQWNKDALKGIFDRMNAVSRGIYIAYCEGDDFWQDPLKLQKQVDAMEKNPDATMCYTGFQTVDEAGQAYYNEKLEQKMKEVKEGDIFFDLLQHHFILTPTTIFRKHIFSSDMYCHFPYYLDYLSFLTSASLGKAIYFPEKTACYRQTPNGAMATQSKMVNERCAMIKDYFLKEYLNGRIKGKSQLKSMPLRLEFMNKSIRKKMIGDSSDIKYLYSVDSLIKLLYIPTYIYIKWQNWRYNHR